MKDPDPFFANSALSIDRLRAFLAVAAAGGFAAAAPGDANAQTRLSQKVRGLEDFFKVALFERRTRGVTLTRKGEKLAALTREFLTRLKDFAAESDPEVVPDVDVGCGDSVQRWLELHCADAFGDRCVHVQMLSGPEVITLLFDSQLDFGIVRDADMGQGLRSAPIIDIDYALYVPKSLLPGKNQLPVKELLEKLPICTLTGEPSFRKQLEDSLEEAGVRQRLRRVVETFPQICDAVLTGQFAAVMPTFVRDRLPPSHYLELKDPVLGKHDTKLHLVWMPRLETQRPEIVALVPAIIERMQRHHRERGR